MTSCNSKVSTKSAKRSSTTTTTDSMTVVFYNVENLFDIHDDLQTNDDDFTPDGKFQWNQKRYSDKLSKLAWVIDAVPGEMPAFIGLSEVENRQVLEDLLAEKEFSSNYMIVHKDSPDTRGIDVAALVDTSVIRIIRYEPLGVTLPDKVRPQTRDILYIECETNGETIHFFVNHWPSRGGGQEETESNRITAANVLKSKVDGIVKKDKNAKVIIMGDFNDYPDNVSVATVLNAGVSQNNALYNYMYDYHSNGTGSYWYQGEWGALDQFITTKNINQGKKGWIAESAYFFVDDRVMFTDKEGNQRPDRTYAGLKYTGGYSDHLAIYLPLVFR